MKRVLTAAVSLMLAASLGRASEVVEVLTWTQLRAEDRLYAGEMAMDRSGDGAHEALLRIENTGRDVHHFRVFTIDSPRIPLAEEKLEGLVRLEGVGSRALVDWAVGVTEEAVMALPGIADRVQIAGGGDSWESFKLVLRAPPQISDRRMLTFGVILAPGGVLYLKATRLTVSTRPAPWWGARAGNLGGAIAGTLLGLLGAAIGVSAGAGRGRRFVFGAMGFFAVVGIVSLSIGLAALIARQPYHVYYPTLLLGVLMVIIPAMSVVPIRRRYQALELRKMQAMDALGETDSEAGR